MITINMKMQSRIRFDVKRKGRSDATKKDEKEGNCKTIEDIRKNLTRHTFQPIKNEKNTISEKTTLRNG